MNAAHFHLIVNHIPMFGAAFSVPVLALAVWRPRETGLMIAAATLLGMSAIGAILADQSGDGAEELVEDLPGVTHALIHEHEERAETSMILACAVAAGAVGGAAWAWRRGETPRWLVAGTVVGAVATTGAMSWTGLAGGQIRHPEIRDDFRPAESEADESR